MYNEVMKVEKVLFLCTGNSARSQMAEAFLRGYGGDRFEAYSAGLEPKGLNPLTVQVMEEAGYDLHGQSSKNLQVYLGKVVFDYIITLCDDADQRCPFFPGGGKRLHWPFEDPAAARGAEAEKLVKFRQVRNQIEERIQIWLRENTKSEGR